MFPFTAKQREEVMTFVLGLVAEPPAEKFVYRPTEYQQAIIEGQKVLDKYNCAACHVLETEKWEIEYRPGELAVSSVADGFPFTNAVIPPDQIVASSSPDKQTGSLSAVLEGMPALAESGHPAVYEYDPTDIDESYAFEIDGTHDYDNTELMRSLTLWRPTVLDGEIADVGVEVRAFPTAVKQRHRPRGGDLALRLLPRILEIERGIGTAVPNSATAWGWLPPPLHVEGTKVQADWLHSFLLEPGMIRPGAIMRMPKFNMSSAEATALVNYFAARDGATYPYEYVEQTTPAELQQREEEYAEKANVTADPNSHHRLDAAMSIIVSGANGCVKCHIFGDYQPPGLARAGNTAPNLENVYKRLRRDYIRPWIANPAKILPYTPMNVVIAHDKPEMWQSSFAGTAEEQLDGVVDLLMNYDEYVTQQSSIKGMVKTQPPAEAAAAN